MARRFLPTAHSLPPSDHPPLPIACRPLPTILSCLVVSLALAPRPAMAHKLCLFATADGRCISGQAYVRDGEPVREAVVSIFAPDGKKLAEVKTDAQGNFTWTAPFRCDHRLVVDGGEGHTAEYTLPASELPESLPAYGARAPEGKTRWQGARPLTPDSSPARGEGSIETAPSLSAAGAGPADGRLEEQVHALSRQIAELRQDLARYKDALRFQDLLGGIGYIFGLMGLAYYFIGVKRKTPPKRP